MNDSEKVLLFNVGKVILLTKDFVIFTVIRSYSGRVNILSGSNFGEGFKEIFSLDLMMCSLS